MDSEADKRPGRIYIGLVGSRLRCESFSDLPPAKTVHWWERCNKNNMSLDDLRKALESIKTTHCPAWLGVFTSDAAYNAAAEEEYEIVRKARGHTR